MRFSAWCTGLISMCAPTPNSEREREREIPRKQAWQGRARGKGCSPVMREWEQEGWMRENRRAEGMVWSVPCTGPFWLQHFGRWGWSPPLGQQCWKSLDTCSWSPTRYCTATDCQLGAGHGPWLSMPAGLPTWMWMDKCASSWRRGHMVHCMPCKKNPHSLDAPILREKEREVHRHHG